MGKAIAIIVCAGVFALFGLITSLIGRGYVASLSEAKNGIILLMVFGPSVAGGILGLIIGCVAVTLGHLLSKARHEKPA